MHNHNKALNKITTTVNRYTVSKRWFNIYFSYRAQGWFKAFETVKPFK